MLSRGSAERGYRLYEEHRVTRLVWIGQELEAHLSSPSCTVQVSEEPDATFSGVCTLCGDRPQLCYHAAAALLRWLDVRTTMQRMGPGTIWRAHSRHPFLAPARTAADRIDLSHLTGADLRSALELQLSLQKTGTAVACLVGHEVEIQITLPSKDERTVVFNAAVLPSALPVLRALPRLELTGDLTGLEISEARLHPVLTATWEPSGIVLEPGFGLTDGAVVAMKDLQSRIHGRWALIGGLLVRLLDPATPLVPFFRKGRQLLKGQEALRFLSLDHPQLRQYSWYQPKGELATFRHPMVPVPKALDARHDKQGRILVRPLFEARDRELSWTEVTRMLQTGFVRVDDMIVRAPELHLFEEAGLRLPKRKIEQGLVGDRISFIRLLAESRLPVVSGDEELRQLAAILQGTSIPDIPKPPGLRSQLRPYQHDGVAWMWSRYLAEVGALLADDMGLGKTHQVMGLLCLVLVLNPAARFLVVCPRGVLEHWDHLLSTFAPEIDTLVFHGPDRSLRELPREGGVVLTTYDIIIRSTPEVTAQKWEAIVFDEAQRIKNPRTKAARAARKLETKFRVALTGTPLENRLTELWSVVDLITPGYLGSEREFRSSYRNPTQAQLKRLRQRLSVLTLRRLKEQVLSDLPEKVEDLRYCRLTKEQENLYRSIHSQDGPTIAEMLSDPDSDIPYMHIFALLTKLKQLCNHPALVKPEMALTNRSGKLEVFDEILDEALAGSHQVVVFSQYVTMIELLSRHLTRRKLDHITLTGETRDRGRVVRRFNSGQHETILLASLLAGGVGIDLTGASVVIHYDRWWNPAKENQATDRVHRIGQKRFVQVFKLVTRETIEERIDAMIQRKTRLLEEVVAPTEDVLRTMSRSELAELLGLRLAERVGDYL
jgi:superfamily II DNA or RNA helicase